MSERFKTYINIYSQPQIEVSVAIDLGASSGRLMIGWLEGERLKTQEIYRFKNKMLFDGVHQTWDLEGIFKHIIQGLKSQVGINIVSIGVDTWGVDYVLLDKTNKLLDKPYAYRDHRTDEVYTRVLDEWDNDVLYRLTGLQFMPFNTLYQLKSHTEQNPQVFKQEPTFLMIPDYFHYRLCGVKSNEFTELSTSQLLEVESRELCEEILSYINIDKNIFPPMYMPGSVLGTVTDEISKETMINSHTKVIAPCTHDTGSSVLASVGGEDSVYISSGTWALMGIVTDKPIVTDIAYQYGFSNEGGVDKSTRLLKNIAGMWIVNRVIEEIAPEKNGYEVSLIAAEHSPFITLINPNDNVFFNPNNMVETIQEYAKHTKQAVPSTLGEIIRCVYDSIALLYNIVLNELERIVNKSFNSINIIGGGCQNVLLNQITANVTRRTILAGPVETSALGNIVLQMISLGIIKDVSAGKEIIKNSESIEVYNPKHISHLDNYLERFKRFYSFRME